MDGDAQVFVYSHFTISSPDCTLHTAITHVIKAVEQWSLT